jgi:hypothetical protein
VAKDIKVSIAYSELWVEILAQEVSYAPDAVNDMMTQAIRAFSDTITELRNHGIITGVLDDSEYDIEVSLEGEEEEEEEEEE